VLGKYSLHAFGATAHPAGAGEITSDRPDLSSRLTGGKELPGAFRRSAARAGGQLFGTVAS